MQVIIPAAGKGSRFSAKGYEVPKPFIRIKGESMLYRVIASLPRTWEVTVIAREEHVLHYRELFDDHPDLRERTHVIALMHDTRGAAETILQGLLSGGTIYSHQEVMVVNCDNLVSVDLDKDFRRHLFGGQHGILTMKMVNDPKWSYVQYSHKDAAKGVNQVSRVAEKQAISDQATCGFYFFSSVSSLLWGLSRMIDLDDRHNGEFYLAPVYNHLIERGDVVRLVEIPTAKFHGVGTPEDLKAYERLLGA